MADIELVIKIDEDIVHGIIDGENDEPRNIVRGFQATIADAIKNGIPLPKGHGKLIDEKKLKKEAIRREWSRIMYDKLDYTLSYMKPIIEADKAESER